MPTTAYGIKPLSIPGAPAVAAPAPTGASLMTAIAHSEPKPVRINRRLGARKTARMAFTPPQKTTAFKTG